MEILHIPRKVWPIEPGVFAFAVEPRQASRPLKKKGDDPGISGHISGDNGGGI